MIFDEDKLSKEERELITEMENMSVPELMAIIQIGEEELKKAINEVIHSENNLDDTISNMTGTVLTLRYYHKLLDKRDVNNMKPEDLKKEYEKCAKKYANKRE